MKRSLITLFLFVSCSNAQLLSDKAEFALVSGISQALTSYMVLILGLAFVSFAFVKLKGFLVGVILGRNTNLDPESITVTTRYGSPKNKLKKRGKNRVVV